MKGSSPFHRGLFTELHRLGYVEGKNLIVERRSGEGKTERYGEVARDDGAPRAPRDILGP